MEKLPLAVVNWDSWRRKDGQLLVNGRSERDAGPKDMQQVYLIRRVVALGVAILVLFACFAGIRWTVGTVSSLRQELAAKPAPAPKVQRTKPKPPPPKPKPVVAWQPSHQDDVGDGDWHEYRIAGEIVDFAVAEATSTKSVKVWDINDGLTGSNSYSPEPSNVKAFDVEIAQANAASAKYFISVHIGSNGESGVIAFYSAQDEQSRLLAERLVSAVASSTPLPNKGAEEAKLYSIEQPRNKAAYRVLLEIGGTSEDIAYLSDPNNRKLVGSALAGVVNGLEP
ncbi:MAG: N-acetylmuramoyl-L-alanine amidase [Actinobacteria bacterium]|nr:MAG: N-acetylmuramoyl-L-alanine amidase [Actinomycetota bacterium]